jgi:hypothetical protein|tara:strand:- start:15 stop:254 length:240 start_codon:yes stop_codon:yes gene_type:complete
MKKIKYFEDLELRFLLPIDSSKLVKVFNEILFKEYELGPYPFRVKDAANYIKKSIDLKSKRAAFVYGVFLEAELSTGVA